jgi:SAM-dependent methyltransferase
VNTRLEKLLRRIDVARQRGLEIGALDKPLLSRADANVRYVDYAPSEELRRAHAATPTVDTTRIVEVDYVWGAQSLRQAVGPDVWLDYVVASHVVEHVPDLVTWFHELAEILRPGGIVSLVVPDKRYTFDWRRRPSALAEVIDAWLARHRRPSIRQLFDFYAHHALVDAAAAWRGAYDDAPPPRVHDEAFALQICRDAAATGRYVDAHCWVFTPASFVDLVRELFELDVLPFRIADFFPTAPGEIDFFVAFERLAEDIAPSERLGLQRASLPW